MKVLKGLLLKQLNRLKYKTLLLGDFFMTHKEIPID